MNIFNVERYKYISLKIYLETGNLAVTRRLFQSSLVIFYVDPGKQLKQYSFVVFNFKYLMIWLS